MLRLSGRQAFRVLLRVDQFAWIAYPPVGTPHQVLAFRKLMREPQAAKVFRFLVYNALPPGQLYGLAGLYLLDRAAFEGTLARLTDRPEIVEVNFLGRACEESFAVLLGSIATGGLSNVLAGDPEPGG